MEAVSAHRFRHPGTWKRFKPEITYLCRRGAREAQGRLWVGLG